MKLKTSEEKHLSSLRSIDESKSPNNMINTVSDELNNLDLNAQESELKLDSFTTKNFKNKRNIFIDDHSNKKFEQKEDGNKNYLNFHRKAKADHANLNAANNLNHVFKKLTEEDEEENNIARAELLNTRFRNKNITINDFANANKYEIGFNEDIGSYRVKDSKLSEFGGELNNEKTVELHKKDARTEKNSVKMNEKELIASIFARPSIDKSLDCFSDKITNLKQIKNLLKFIMQNKDEEANEFIFSFLIKNFKDHKINTNLFNNISIKKPNSSDLSTLSDIIIEKLLNSNTNINNNSKMLLLETIFSNLGCNKKSIALVIQKLRFIYENPNQDVNKNSHSHLLFNAISIFKTMFAIASNANFPKNYLYFNSSSGLRISKNKNGVIKNANKNYKINATNGFSFFLWFKLEKELMHDSEKESVLISFKIQNQEFKSNINLILFIKQGKLFIKTNEDLVNTRIHEFCGNWNFMFFAFKNFKNSSTEKIIVNYIINDNNHINQIFIDEKNLWNAEIKEIKLFENFIGYSTSFAYLNSAVSEKNILNFRDFCKENFPFGVYSEAKLQKFLNKSSNKILSFYAKEKSKKKSSLQNLDNFNFNDVTYSEIIVNTKNTKSENNNNNINNNNAENKIKSNKGKNHINNKSTEKYRVSYANKYSLISNISKQIKNTLKEIINKIEIFIVPFRSRRISIEEWEKTDNANSEKNFKLTQRIILLDIKRNCDFEFLNVDEESNNQNAYKTEKSCEKFNSGISAFSNIHGDLALLDSQGMNNLLPVLELISTFDFKNNKENLLYFMKLIYLIIYDREKNMKNILDKNFFKNAKFYLETLDKGLFGGDLADVFVDIFKHLSLYKYKNQTYLSFLENFIANENILLKFQISKQVEIWDVIYCHLNESNELLKFFQIEKLLIILKEYDKMHYFEYCCKHHKESMSVFKVNSEGESQLGEKVMNPSLNQRIYHILMILYLSLNETLIAESDEELSKLTLVIKLLILDFSPCVKKGLIMIINECFKNPNKNLDKILAKLEKEGFLNILIYLYSISCIDLRRKIVELIKTLTKIESIKASLSNGTEAFYYRKILPFLKKNLLNFRLNKSNFCINLIPNVNELLAEKALQQIENELTKQLKLNISSENKDKEQVNMGPFASNIEIQIESEKNLNEKKLYENQVEDLSKAVESMKVTEKGDQDQIIERFLNKDSNMKKSKHKKFQFNLDININPNSIEDSVSDSKLNNEFLISNNNVNLINLENNHSTNSQEKEENLQSFNYTFNKKDSNLPLKKDAVSLKSGLDFASKTEKAYDFPFSKEKAGAVAGNEKLAFNSEGNFYKNKQNKNNIISSGLGDISVRNSRTFTKKGPGKPLNLGIDTQAINELYLYGGDKHESNQSLEKKHANFEEKIKLLAQHCVEFMTGNADEAENCGFYCSDILFREKDCSLSEITQSLGKIRAEKNNEKKVTEESKELIKNRENERENNDVEIKNDFNFKYEVKLNKKVINTGDNKLTSSNYADKFNLETTTKSSKNKSISNHFSAKAPLPTSKNKDSKSFSFGKNLAIQTSENTESDTGSSLGYLEFDNKKDTKLNRDTGSINVRENAGETLTLPKNKKCFLRNNKKTINLSLDIDSFDKQEPESFKNTKEDSDGALNEKPEEKAFSFKSNNSSSSGSPDKNSRFSDKNRFKNEHKITEIVEENVNDDLNEIETPKAAAGKLTPKPVNKNKSFNFTEDDIKIYEELPIIEKAPSVEIDLFEHNVPQKNTLREDNINTRDICEEEIILKNNNSNIEDPEKPEDNSVCLNLEIKIPDLIYSINQSDIEDKIPKLPENLRAESNKNSLDSPSSSLEFNLIQLYQSLVNWLLDMDIENEESKISERFSCKTKNQKHAGEDLFEKNLSAELHKKSYAFQESNFSYSAYESTNINKNNSSNNFNNNNNHRENNYLFKRLNNVKEKNYLIKNPEVIQILIKFTQITNLRFSYKLLIEINELLCLNNFNCYVLYKNDFFFNWLRELIFSAFLIHNKNLNEEGKIGESTQIPCDAGLLSKEIHSLFMLGKKVFVKIILEISANFDFDEVNKKLNNLFNWAIHLKHFRNLEYEEIELTCFVFEILNEVFSGLKDKYESNFAKFQDAFNNLFYMNLDLINSSNLNSFNKNGGKLSNDTLKILKENYFSESKSNNTQQQVEETKNCFYSGFQISDLFCFQNNLSVSLLNFINFSFFYYEFLTFFNISKNPFVCIKSLDYENLLRNSTKRTKLIPDVIRENNLFNILRVFKKEKNFTSDQLNNLNTEESAKLNSFECDLGLQKNFNKLFYSLNGFNKSFMGVISNLWKNNIMNQLNEQPSLYLDDKNNLSLDFLKQENVDFLIKDYVIDKENKNCFLNSLSVLFMKFSFEKKENEANEFSGFNSSKAFDASTCLIGEENCFKLGLLNEELKFKIKSLLNINKKGTLNVYDSHNLKEKVLKTRENYMKNKKSFYMEFEKIMKEINSTNESSSELNDNNIFNKDEKTKKKKSNFKNPCEAKETRHKSIHLLEIINCMIVLKLENLREEFYDFYSNQNIESKNAPKNNGKYLKEIKEETIFYLLEYQSILLFLAFASSNMKSKNNENYEVYTNQITEILLYSVIYIYDALGFSKLDEFEDSFISENYAILFKNVFGTMLSIYEKILEKKRKKSFMNKLIPKKSNKDLMNCAVYRILTDHLAIQGADYDRNKAEKKPLINNQFCEEFKKTEIKFLAELLKNNEFDSLLLLDRDFIHKRIESNFDLDCYLNVLAHRTKAAENSKPVDLNFIFRNYRTTNFILYNISRESSQNANITDKPKSLSDNLISKNFKLNKENKFKNSNNFLSEQNLNKFNLYSNNGFNNNNNEGLVNYEGLNKGLSDVENNLTKFYYTRKFEDLNSLNNLKSLKYKLFTWCGLWVDQELNEPNLSKKNFKWKVLNHNTKYFYKPLLKAIIDFPMHFPKNSKFDADVLFKEDVQIKDKKLTEISDKEAEFTYDGENAVLKITKKFKQNEQLDIENYKETLKQQDFFLKHLNKTTLNNLSSDFQLWKSHQKLNDISNQLILLPFKINKALKEGLSINNENSEFSVSFNIKNKFENILESIYDLEQFKDLYNIFEICYVKLTFHFQCYLKFTSSGFDIFTNFSNQNVINNSNQNKESNYDKNKEDCYGSFIKPNEKQRLRSKFYRNFSFQEIHFILKRNYYLTDSAVELYSNSKSYYLNFINKEERRKFLRIVKVNINKLRKIKIDKVNSNTTSSQKDNIFGLSNYKNLENLSEKELNKLSSFNNSLNLNEFNHSENNLRKLNLNENLGLGLKPINAKNITISARKEKNNKKKKYVTVGYENLSIADSFSSVFKKEKKSPKKTNYKSFNNYSNCNSDNNSNNKLEKEYFKSIKVNQILEEWSKNKNISNFDLLLLLNLLANRSFTDVTQYPVFPWILGNYEDSDFLNNDCNKNNSIKNNSSTNKTIFRDLSSPMGMYGDSIANSACENRINSYSNTFKSLLEDYQAGESLQTPYFYGSLYSNVIYVAYYLIRLFPFTKLAVEFQGGKFDCYARIFKSIAESFSNASTITGDVRELIPEFFFLPEMFINLNNLNLNRKMQKTKINESERNKIFSTNKNNDTNNNNKNFFNFTENYNVSLPTWAEGNPYFFSAKHKEILESPEVSANLADWIDLIFGFRQAGKNAVEAKNVYFSDAYLINNSEFNLKEESEEERNLKLKFIEFGLIPRQIINCKVPRKIKNESKDNTQLLNKKTSKVDFDNCNNNINNNLKNGKDCLIQGIFSFNELDKFKNEVGRDLKLLKMRYIQENNSLMCLFSSNCVYQIILPALSNKEGFEFNSISKKIISENLRFKENYDFESSLTPFSLKMPEFYEEHEATNAEKVIYIAKNGKSVAQGGYYDGKIRLIQLDSNNKNNLKLISTQKQPNVYLFVDTSERYAFTGSLNGFVTVFRIGEKFNVWKKIKTLKDHENNITCITANEYLNILASSCADGKINLYTIPKFEIFRTIDLNYLNKIYKPFSINNLFISDSPLACVAAYCKNNNRIFTYSINGEKLNEEDLNNANAEIKTVLISCSEIFKDENFSDNLFFSFSDGKIQLRKFPYLQDIVSFEAVKGIENETFSVQSAKSLIKISNSNVIYYEMNIFRFPSNTVSLLRITRD